MNKDLVSQLLEYFKATFGLAVNNAEQLFDTQRNLLEYLIGIGRELENRMFEELGKGYEGVTIERDGKKYKFVGYRPNTIHGLFGEIHYQRAYYLGEDKEAGSSIPLDERLGITKRHTPGFNYFLSSFTGREAYQESLNRFHEIFRPDGKHLVSMRKALDMDYELGSRLEEQRQKEIKGVFEQRQPMEVQREIEGTMAVSIDATKVREKLGEYVDDAGTKKYKIGFRDAKIGAISEVGWDPTRSEAYCTASSYVGGIEHADEFFPRVWVEMNRRAQNPEKMRIVFLGDGAPWIWDRVPDLENNQSVWILDFYHATEHLSEICKEFYGEQTEQYWQQFTRWRESFLKGKVEKVIAELKQMRGKYKGKKRHFLQGQINYFEENKERMRYDRYLAMKLPIGSGTIESACKNVIGARMKQGGMTWTESGAEGMLQIRASLGSERFLQDFRSTLRLAA
jgi:hypothetical protein